MRTAIKVLAILLNLTLLVWSVGVTVQDRINGAGDVALAALLIVTPVLTLIALVFSTQTADATAGWLTLWMQRKKAEERKKLKELESEP